MAKTQERIVNPEIARKAILAGIGAIALGMERAQEIFDELVSKGEVTQKDLEKRVVSFRSTLRKSTSDWRSVAQDLRKRAEKRVESVQKQAREAAQKATSSLGLASAAKRVRTA